MIIRQFIWRQSRCCQIKPFKPWAARCFASAVDSIEASLQNQLKETHSIESLIQQESSKAVPQINDQRHTTTDPLHEKIAGLTQVQIREIRRRHIHKDREIGTRLSAEAAEMRGPDINPALKDTYSPQSLINHPPRPEEITLEMLLAAQCHLGHHTSLWNPMNSRYIFGIRQGIHVISLETTAAHLRRACRVVQGIVERGGLVLFVGTREGQYRCVVNAAKRTGGCHLFERWTPGALTNGHQILGNCKMRVVDEFDREVPGYADKLKDMPSLKPDLVVCLNPLENWVLLHECGMNGIPTIGIVDTDANPTWVTYPIPANDDSMRSVQLIAGVLGRAGQEGREERFRMARRGEVLYTAGQLEPPGETGKMATGGMNNEINKKKAWEAADALTSEYRKGL